MSRCHLCLGERFIAVGDPAKNTVRPCERCLPATHSEWRAGKYRPTHATILQAMPTKPKRKTRKDDAA